MKKTLLILLTVLTSLPFYSQDITGQWNGILKVPGGQLRMVIHISKTDAVYSATMDSPDQGAKGIPATTIGFENSILKFEIANLKVEYTGTINEKNIIVGYFKQGGYTVPLELSRETIQKEVLVRPQEPTKPYPYYSEDVTFENKKDKIVLAGTLTLPKKEGKFPVVILISGSGPQNRDEEILGHKPFLVLSDYLTKNGIAVLRFDDRGTAESKGDFNTATTADFATDIEAALQYLQSRKEINKKKIGLIGHSEGGIIAPMIASKTKDVNFIVLLAGTGIPGNQLLILQNERIGRASGMSEMDLQKAKLTNKTIFDIIAESRDAQTTEEKLTAAFKQMIKENAGIEKPEGMSEDDFINTQVKQLTSPWTQYFIKYDPSIALEKVKCPVLAINGEKDLQVPAKENLEAIKKALLKGGNKKITIKELPNLNHLFQECKTGSPEEYAKIEQTFSLVALQEVTNWILAQVK